MQIKNAPPSIVWMSASLLLALWIGYLAGGVLLRYPDFSSGSGLRLSASVAAKNSEPKSESIVPAVPPTTAKNELPPPVRNVPEAHLKTEAPSSVEPTQQPIVRHDPAVESSASVLQIAALTRNADARALAEAMGKKGFPAFVLNPTTDGFYRVQIGPFPDRKSAAVTKDKLEAQGFQVFMKRQ